MEQRLSAELRIMRQIILDTHAGNDPRPPLGPLDTKEQIEQTWDEYLKEGYPFDIRDAQYEFRHSGEETKIPVREHSRYYENEEVGRKLDDGTWVGWAYWHGGGKHGDPDGIDWMSEAYDLDVTEEEKMVIVRTFKINEWASYVSADLSEII